MTDEGEFKGLIEIEEAFTNDTPEGIAAKMRLKLMRKWVEDAKKDILNDFPKLYKYFAATPDCYEMVYRQEDIDKLKAKLVKWFGK